MRGIKSNKVNFYKTKYGKNLLIDLIRLESLEKYINSDKPHYLSYFDITLITCGKGLFYLDSDTYKLKEGLVVFSSPFQLRKWDFKEVPQGYVLIFEKSFLTSFFNDSNFIEKLRYFNKSADTSALNLDIKEVSHIVGIFEDIINEIKDFKSNDEHILRALLYQVLIWLNRKFCETELPQTTKESNRHISQFVDLVSHKFKQEHNVSFYANELNISSGHLNDLSKLILGVNAKKYISGKLIEEAKKQLILTDSSVSEIALNLGFIDASYFVRKFKAETGNTPLLFRKDQIL